MSLKRAASSAASMVASLCSPQAASTSASIAWSTAKRSGVTGDSPRSGVGARSTSSSGTACGCGSPSCVGCNALERRCDPLDELGRGEGGGQAVEADQPAGELLPVGDRGRVEQRAVVAVLERPVLADGALDQPGGVGLDQDRRLLVALAELPRGAVAVGARVELGRHAEVALAAGREAHVAAHAVEPEGAHVVAVVIAPDHVPVAAHEVEAVGVDRPCRLLVGGDRPVAEDDGALLRDGGLELLQPQRDLGREAAPEQPHGHLGRGVVRRVRAAEREVLERQPQRLGVGELAVEQVHGGRERRELGVAEVEARQEVVLLQERVELLAREVVALRLQRHAEREQLAAVGVEAAREGLVRHLRVALDGLLDVARGRGAPLGHQVRDERELADELVGVGCHGGQESMRGEGPWRLPRMRNFGPSRPCDDEPRDLRCAGCARGARSTMRAWHRAACRPCAPSVASVRGLWCARGPAALPGPRPRARPIPPGGRPTHACCVQSAPPSRPLAARFGTGLAGWTLLGPGAVAVRAGGPGGHYAALRDNTTLETPPLPIARGQQVLLITARAPVGSPLLHVTALGADGVVHVLGDLRPTASWDTFAFNAAGLGGQQRAARARSGDGATGRRRSRARGGERAGRGRHDARAGRRAPSRRAPGRRAPDCRRRAVRAAHGYVPRGERRGHDQRLDPRYRRPAPERHAESRRPRRSARRSPARPGAPFACRWPRCAAGGWRCRSRATTPRVCSSPTWARCSARPRCASGASCRPPRMRRRELRSASS